MSPRSASGGARPCPHRLGAVEVVPVVGDGGLVGERAGRALPVPERLGLLLDLPPEGRRLFEVSLVVRVARQVVDRVDRLVLQVVATAGSSASRSSVSERAKSPALAVRTPSRRSAVACSCASPR